MVVGRWRRVMQKTASLWISCRPCWLLVWSVSRQRGGVVGGVQGSSVILEFVFCRRVALVNKVVDRAVASCREPIGVLRAASDFGWLTGRVSCARCVRNIVQVLSHVELQETPQPSLLIICPPSLFYTSLSRCALLTMALVV